ncbi:MAG TPA: SO2930 family diheme c-type cytochrome [Phnomibacter sp.]|nr:SO2930 family diheme c-type cytochrome [Phnomibacter sp.]
MKKIGILGCMVGAIFLFCSFERRAPSFEFHTNLSEWDFFKGDMKLLQPAKGVVPFDLNTPLFSDYALKERFIRLPKGVKAVYSDTGIFDMPEGTILIKNFSFPFDFKHPEKGRRIVETRLLIKRADGWLPYQYIWNDAQTEAVFEPIGGITTVAYSDAHGKKVLSKYIIPNQMQCRGCHRQNNVIMPIGLAARHLNGDYAFESGTQNQLQYWAAHNMMDIPAEKMPANVHWSDASASVESRARAYLDINCGFCHKPGGVAATSGLFLHAASTNNTALGINKTPVAAGRGSGGFQFDIVPGHPEKSIMIFRMTSMDPGIAMPEIGRLQMHKEGVNLISDWIRQMQP